MAMKIAFVVPRYGADIRGGAETGARMLAERLVADRGHDVEVLTTCALDAITWRDELPEGTTVSNGVRVHRIRSAGGRDEHFHPLWAQLRDDPAHASPADMERWVDLQGPLVARPARGRGGQRRRRPGVLSLPLLPDGARAAPGAPSGPCCTRRRTRSRPCTCPLFDELFAQCRGLRLPQPERAGAGQRALRRGGHAAGADRSRRRGAEAGRRRAVGTMQAPVRGWRSASDDVPYLVCIGRVDDQKGTGMLWRFFRAYKRAPPRPAPARLRRAGGRRARCLPTTSW